MAQQLFAEHEPGQLNSAEKERLETFIYDFRGGRSGLTEQKATVMIAQLQISLSPTLGQY